MAKKVFIFDSFESVLFICEFEGLDADGKPRLTIMTPGYPVENFLEHLDCNDDDEYDYYLLCEEGKSADSKIIIEMLGQVFLNSIRPYERLSARLEELRKWGIDYDHELQKLTVRILEYNDEETKSSRYRLLMYIGEHNHYIGGGEDMFDNLKDICSKMSSFFYFIENQTHIPLKKYLEVNESLKKQMERIASNVFDRINVL